MDGNGDQEQESDQIRSQMRGGFLVDGSKAPPDQLLFASEKQALQHHPAAAAEASLSLFFPTTHQPHNQGNDTAGTTAYSSSSSSPHKPTNNASPTPPGPADQLDNPPAATTRFRWMRELFSLGQWQELELQALIYKYMLAGASIPMELILPIKRSLIAKAALNQYQQYHHQEQHPSHQASPLLQAAGGYWGRCAIDPEPGRCRRTDGKKWRCSREVMPGRRYCERHALRGKNRSRKLVEAPPSPPSPVAVPGDGGGTGGSLFPSGINTMLMLRESGRPSSVPSASAMGIAYEQRPQSDLRMIAESYHYPALLSHEGGLPNDNTCGRVLRHFFDDWPRASHHQGPYNTSADRTISGPHHPAASGLSISAPEKNQPSSDFCLKLYTGSGDKCSPGNGGSKDKVRFVDDEQLAWPRLGRQMEGASMGGPLAEALGGANTSVPLHSNMTILQVQRPI